MSWSELGTTGPGTPLGLSIREIVLGVLADHVLTLREAAGCADCKPGQVCDDHAEDAAFADAIEAAYMRLRGIGSDGAVLRLLGGLT